MRNSKYCLHKLVAEQQAINEALRGQDSKGIQAYKDQGCFDCNGYNSQCSKYIPQKELQEKPSQTEITHPSKKIHIFDHDLVDSRLIKIICSPMQKK